MIGDWLYQLSKHKSRQNLYAWITEAVKTDAIRNARTLINIGAGGEVAKLLNDLNIQVRSLDVDPKRQPDIVANVESMDQIANSSVDVVFCIEVLEHVTHPETAVAEIKRILRPGGTLIGSTPFLLGIHDPPGDYYRFTKHGLRYLFASYDEVSLRERNGYFAAIAALIYRRFALDAPLGGLAWLKVPIMLILAIALEQLNYFFPSSDGTSGYFFVFRKSMTTTSDT